MSTHDLYGVRNLTLVEARASVERALDISLEERESAYQGGTYYRFRAPEAESFTLKNNLDPFDGEPAEQAYAEYRVLLYVDGTRRAGEVGSLLGPEFCLLRHEVCAP